MKLITDFLILLAYSIAIYIANLILGLIFCAGLIIIAVLLPRVHTKAVKNILQKASDGR